MSGKKSAFLMFFTAVCAACGATLTTPLEPGEFWWGGQVTRGAQMPYSAKAPFACSLVDDNRQNQCAGLLVSSKGRYVWNGAPFAFAFTNGQLVAKGGGAFDLGRAAVPTLRGAFMAAASRHFPASGKMPDEALFDAPQWNTWIELTYNQNQADVLKYAKSILANGFKPGVIMIDDTWQTDYGVWRFEPRRFPDPKAMCDRLHAMGFKLMLWICPFVSPDSGEYRNELMQQKGVLMDAARSGRPALFHWWNGYSACVDLSSPAGRGWFKAQLDRLSKDFGVDGFKFDAGDMNIYAAERYLAFDPAGTAPEAQSRLFCEIGLDYPLNEYRAAWQMGGQALAQRLADKTHSWEAVRHCVTDTLAQGLIGYAFTCPDMIGGGSWTSFRPEGKFDRKLVVRSAQVHALMPMMQFSANPWRIMTEPEEKKYLDAILRAAAIHQESVPQILALARDSAQTGEPIIRHMAYVFPDEGLEEVRDQFVLGNDMIVAPVMSADDARTVRLPAGAWRGDDGTVVTGPATIELRNVPIDRLPRWSRVKRRAD